MGRPLDKPLRCLLSRALIGTCTARGRVRAARLATRPAGPTMKPAFSERLPNFVPGSAADCTLRGDGAREQSPVLPSMLGTLLEFPHILSLSPIQPSKRTDMGETDFRSVAGSSVDFFDERHTQCAKL